MQNLKSIFLAKMLRNHRLSLFQFLCIYFCKLQIKIRLNTFYAKLFKQYFTNELLR